MKRSGNKTLKIVAATSMSIFSLLTVFVACYAWFSANTDVQNNGANINIVPKTGRLKYVYFHSFVSNQSNDSTFSFNKTAFATYEYNWASNTMELQEEEPDIPDNWNMGDYTYLNRHHPFLMLFEFDQEYTSTEVGDMYVQAKTTVGGDGLVTNYAPNDTGHTDPYTTGGGFLGARDANGVPYYTLPQTNVKDENNPERILIKKETRNGHTYDYYALSSVASFSNKGYSETQYSAITAGSYISIATNTLETDEKFTNINNVTDRYYFNQTPYIYKSNGSETVKYIAVIVDYYVDAIGYIYSTYLGDSGLNRYDSILYFACDWSLEVV